MSEALSRRLEVARFIAILLVAVSHAKNYGLRVGGADLSDSHAFANVYVQEAITEGFCRVAVPLFMAISGYLLFRGYRESASYFADKLRRRLRTLVVPYILWSLIALTFIYALQLIPFSRGYFAGERVDQWDFWQLLWRVFVQPSAGQLWFLRDLICFVAIAPILGPVLRRWPVPAMLVLTALWLAGVTWLGVRIFYPNSQGLWFFSFGACCQLHKLDIERPVQGLGWLLAVWIAIVLVRTPYLMQSKIVAGLHPVGLIAGVLVVWAFAGYITPWVFRHGLEPYMLSFFIFVAHEAAQTIVEKLLLRFGAGVPFVGIMILAVAPLISVTACTLVGMGLRRAAPSLYGILTGGRGLLPGASGRGRGLAAEPSPR